MEKLETVDRNSKFRQQAKSDGRFKCKDCNFNFTTNKSLESHNSTIVHLIEILKSKEINWHDLIFKLHGEDPTLFTPIDKIHYKSSDKSILITLYYDLLKKKTMKKDIENKI